jgi:hypothetical protein
MGFLPAILKGPIKDFSDLDEKIWYAERQDPKLLSEIGTDLVYELKNQHGKIIVTRPDCSIFKMRRIK